MSEVQQTIFTVIREDRPEVDPKTVVAEGLRIGRLADSDIWLNHPLVSRLHGLGRHVVCYVNAGAWERYPDPAASSPGSDRCPFQTPPP